MADAYEALLLLGGNVGDSAAMLARAEELISARAGRIQARSRDHWTEPWGFTDDRLFLNRAVLISTALEPTQLLAVLLEIERDLGRVRNEGPRYTARSIDIDILLIGEHVIVTPLLQVPHPRLHERAFALAPAADIVPQWVHPNQRRTVLQLLNDLRRPTV